MKKPGVEAYCLVGAHTEMVDLRKYVEMANLTTYDSYVTGQRSSRLAVNHYDTAISIYEIRRSVGDWQ